MTSRSLRTTTAIFAALSLLQPLPAQTQSSADVRSFEEICAEAMIADALACELHIKELQIAAEAEAQAAVDAAEQAAAEAEAAAQAATEAEPDTQADAAAEADELDRVAAEAEAQAAEAASAAGRLAAEAEAAAQAAADAEAQAAGEATEEAEGIEFEKAETEADAEAEPAADAQAEADAQVQAEADAAAQAEADAEADALAETESAAQAEAGTDQDDEPVPEAITEALEANEPVAEDCLAEDIDADGSILCVDELTGEGIAAIADEDGTEADTEVEVTTETVTESTHRSSSEEFSETTSDAEGGTSTAAAGGSAMEQRDTGMSDLEKAGLFVLGAVVVGAILSNGQRVEANTGDRVIVLNDDGSHRVLKDDDALLRQPGSEVRTERFNDGSTRTTVTRDDGTQIITIRDSTGRALRRVRIEPDGREYLLIDDTRTFDPVIVRDLPRPIYDDFDYRAATDREALRQALLAADQRGIGRSFSLRQVRDYVEVRELAPEINFGAVTFATNSAALQPSQAEQLREMGLLMRDLIADDPTELFLIEGHTDAIGDAGYNLLLSDRRSESVALALSEYFQVPTENMVVQGYGERFLRVPSQSAERLNRRVAVRRITPLLQQN
ncbi:OmpA family protein [Maritimibacter sp. HL-12]|uniref:OmpA family protein n=1 Tax=Maritimibacter sp. HL-12 TaxID=1162418 RepID=UPI000A0EF323|nr:OmpA family protein [Maritimibacter sp. HL-12]SMH46821.1 Outer membrane protein and related peptidoglycan-associated (lipo)proteins [Maritimibacter sp. HL-12]